jgi:hypothetical protein
VTFLDRRLVTGVLTSMRAMALEVFHKRATNPRMSSKRSTYDTLSFSDARAIELAASVLCRAGVADYTRGGREINWVSRVVRRGFAAGKGVDQPS